MLRPVKNGRGRIQWHISSFLQAYVEGRSRVCTRKHTCVCEKTHVCVRGNTRMCVQGTHMCVRARTHMCVCGKTHMCVCGETHMKRSENLREKRAGVGASRSLGDIYYSVEHEFPASRVSECPLLLGQQLFQRSCAPPPRSTTRARALARALEKLATARRRRLMRRWRCSLLA